MHNYFTETKKAHANRLKNTWAFQYNEAIMQHIKQKPQVTYLSRPVHPIASDYKVSFKDILIANLVDLFKGAVVIAIMFVLYVVISYALSSLIWGV